MNVAAIIAIFVGATVAAISFGRIKRAAMRPANGEKKNLAKIEESCQNAGALITMIRKSSAVSLEPVPK